MKSTINNLNDGTDDTLVINARQLCGLQRYISEDLYEILNILNLYIKLMKEEMHKFHGDMADVPDDDSTYLSPLIDKGGSCAEVDDDWRSHFD